MRAMFADGRREAGRVGCGACHNQNEVAARVLVFARVA